MELFISLQWPFLQHHVNCVLCLCICVSLCVSVCLSVCEQYVFKTESHGFRTVHEELAKGMTFDLKSNEQAAVRNVLRVRTRLCPLK